MALTPKKAKGPIPNVLIPKHDPADLNGDALKTPKTPADEGIEFFESATIQIGQPICVYELRLDPDGGPNRDRSVEYFSLRPLYRIHTHSNPVCQVRKRADPSI